MHAISTAHAAPNARRAYGSRTPSRAISWANRSRSTTLSAAAHLPAANSASTPAADAADTALSPARAITVKPITMPKKRHRVKCDGPHQIARGKRDRDKTDSRTYGNAGKRERPTYGHPRFAIDHLFHFRNIPFHELINARSEYLGKNQQGLRVRERPARFPMRKRWARYICAARKFLLRNPKGAAARDESGFRPPLSLLRYMHPRRCCRWL